MLQSLVELARHTSSESRRDVMHALSRLFVDGASDHTERELALFGDILVRLIDQVAEEDRLALSRRISRTQQTPHNLAMKLALDESRVAAPILEFSPVLSEPDLVAIAGEVGQDHLMAIARRANIVEPITDVLIRRGELMVINTAARNLSARFSEESLHWVGMRALVDPLLGEALSMRPDLPTATARKIMGVLQPDARRRVQTLLAENGERVADLMGRAIQLLDLSRTETNRQRGDLRRMLADIRSSHRKLDDAIDELIFQKRFADIATLMAELVRVPETYVSIALHKVNATGIGVISRALKLSDPTFRRLCCLRCEKLRLPVSQADQMLRDYENITAEMAEQTLRYHKTRDTLRGVKGA